MSIDQKYFLKRLLLVIDGSQESDSATEYALRLAAKLGTYDFFGFWGNGKVYLCVGRIIYSSLMNPRPARGRRMISFSLLDECHGYGGELQQQLPFDG